ncbi:hypothetical protein KCH_71160 [Kitasatospora cheerisanensis KCTC 2395]|uniref:Uncharacterized protein n=1 Tax=Kitasatospora cheerisanensis KCTC 2395 TaxID=1348663 RepID=A0A066YIN6_9ACTN|nr:hypothetical protein KCH_71160 [Kitasatospora cheerisanensis KCTC 2395]
MCDVLHGAAPFAAGWFWRLAGATVARPINAVHKPVRQRLLARSMTNILCQSRGCCRASRVEIQR